MSLEYLRHDNHEWGRSRPNLAMQVHIDCHPDICATKAAAYWALVDAGKLVPDSGRA
ncbi:MULTISPECIES: hypothetical protein [unclassified Nocardia]|uniref:hypothetical protein n=1 Tax=unclassified Nocardia TaxID=2637762 RepID=UPI0024A8BB62|nr:MULTISPECIES: hypothetical protein [unclassified Nocardia]